MRNASCQLEMMHLLGADERSLLIPHSGPQEKFLFFSFPTYFSVRNLLSSSRWREHGSNKRRITAHLNTSKF